MSLSFSKWAAVLPFAALLAGCGGPKPVSVSGKIVMPDKVKVVDTDTITLVFNPEDGTSGASDNATASAKDLTFKASIKPGKYKVSVNVQAYAGQGGPKDSRERPKELAQAFGGFSPGSTPLRCEVTGEPNQTFTVDLNAKTVGK